jgi:hypothetical protein
LKLKPGMSDNRKRPNLSQPRVAGSQIGALPVWPTCVIAPLLKAMRDMPMSAPALEALLAAALKHCRRAELQACDPTTHAGSQHPQGGGRSALLRSAARW